ncbi:MAG: SRPBCC family protein [Caldilineaceae bacterium]|nr:SRPBCC family protein [Caldilineaceae bacterium]
MTVKNEPKHETAGRELIIERVFDAPRELVFDAWTDPAHVAHWWGPTGFTTTTQGMDVREGGIWRFIMHGPDGTDYPNKIVYTEVVKPERLVYVHGDDKDDNDGDKESDAGQFQVTVTFAEQGNQTQITMRMLFATTAEFDAAKEMGAVTGANQTLDRLEKFLAQA